MLSKKEQQLLDIIESRAQGTDIEIVTIEVIGSSKSPVIRVYIDTADGVSFNELTKAQEWIGDLMDEVDPFPGAYTLEVSSPGIDRPLRTLEHFERFCGEDAKIRTVSEIDGRLNFTGRIEGTREDSVILDVDGKLLDILISNIKRANLIGKIDFN